MNDEIQAHCVDLLRELTECMRSIDDSLRSISTRLEELRPTPPAPPKKVASPVPSPTPAPKKANPAPAASGERKFPDDLIKHYLVLAHENHFPQMNTFQREFSSDVPEREGPLTGRQYAVAMNILQQFGYDEDRITDEWLSEEVPDHPFGSYKGNQPKSPQPAEDDDSDLPF